MGVGRKAELFLVGAAAGAHRTLDTLQLRRKVRRTLDVTVGRPAVSEPNDHDGMNAMVTSAARRLGISVEPLPGKFLRLRRGDKVILSHSSDFPFDRTTAYLASRNKWLTSTVLADEGIPVPRSRAFMLAQYHDAVQFFRELPKPVVVKPNRDTGGGTGVLLNIASEGQLRRAFIATLLYSQDVLVEEQVPGENYRITVLAGRVLSVIRRRRANVVGDGQRSIGELIAATNAAFHREDPEIVQILPITIDSEVHRVLRRNRLRLTSVPPAGQRVFLRDTGNAHTGAELEDLTPRTHPDYIELAISSSAAMGITLCGVDLMTTDIERPIGEATVHINEVNTTPGFDTVFPPYGPRRHDKAAEAVLRHAFDLPYVDPSELSAVPLDSSSMR